MKTKQPTVKAPLPHRVQIIKYSRAIAKIIRQARQARDASKILPEVERMLVRLDHVGCLAANKIAPDGQRITAEDRDAAKRCHVVLERMFLRH